MPKPLKFDFGGGKVITVNWPKDTDPTPADLEDIERGIRKNEGLPFNAAARSGNPARVIAAPPTRQESAQAGAFAPIQAKGPTVPRGVATLSAPSAPGFTLSGQVAADQEIQGAVSSGGVVPSQRPRAKAAAARFVKSRQLKTGVTPEQQAALRDALESPTLRKMALNEAQQWENAVQFQKDSAEQQNHPDRWEASQVRAQIANRKTAITANRLRTADPNYTGERDAATAYGKVPLPSDPGRLGTSESRNKNFGRAIRATQRFVGSVTTGIPLAFAQELAGHPTATRGDGQYWDPRDRRFRPLRDRINEATGSALAPVLQENPNDIPDAVIGSLLPLALGPVGGVVGEGYRLGAGKIARAIEGGLTKEGARFADNGFANWAAGKQLRGAAVPRVSVDPLDIVPADAPLSRAAPEAAQKPQPAPTPENRAATGQAPTQAAGGQKRAVPSVAPEAATLSAVPPAKKGATRVEVNGKHFDLEGEAAAAHAEAVRVRDGALARAKEEETQGFVGAQQAEKTRRSASERYSADVRRITGELSPTEAAAAKQSAEKVVRGSRVKMGERAGVAQTDVQFNRVVVKFDDGETVRVPRADLTREAGEASGPRPGVSRVEPIPVEASPVEVAPTGKPAPTEPTFKKGEKVTLESGRTVEVAADSNGGFVRIKTAAGEVADVDPVTLKRAGEKAATPEPTPAAEAPAGPIKRTGNPDANLPEKQPAANAERAARLSDDLAKAAEEATALRTELDAIHARQPAKKGAAQTPADKKRAGEIRKRLGEIEDMDGALTRAADKPASQVLRLDPEDPRLNFDSPKYDERLARSVAKSLGEDLDDFDAGIVDVQGELRKAKDSQLDRARTIDDGEDYVAQEVTAQARAESRSRAAKRRERERMQAEGVTVADATPVPSGHSRYKQGKGGEWNHLGPVKMRDVADLDDVVLSDLADFIETRYRGGDDGVIYATNTGKNAADVRGTGRPAGGARVSELLGREGENAKTRMVPETVWQAYVKENAERLKPRPLFDAERPWNLSPEETKAWVDHVLDGKALPDQAAKDARAATPTGRVEMGHELADAKMRADAPAPRADVENLSADNATMGAARGEMGLSDIDPSTKEKLGDWMRDATTEGVIAEARNIAAAILKPLAKARILTDVETTGLLARLQQIRNGHRAILADVAGDPVLRLARLEVLEEEFDTISRALKQSGTEWGRAGVARQLELNSSYDVLSLKQRAKVASGAKGIPKGGEARIESMATRYETVDDAIVAREKELDAIQQTLERKQIEQDAEKALRIERLSNRQSRRGEQRGAIRDKRAEIKAQLKKDFFAAVNTGTAPAALPGLPPQIANMGPVIKGVRDLFKSYAEDATLGLKEIVDLVVTDAASIGVKIKDTDVLGIVGGRVKVKGSARTMSEAARRLHGLRGEARDLTAKPVKTADQKAAERLAKRKQDIAEEIAVLEQQMRDKNFPPPAVKRVAETDPELLALRVQKAKAKGEIDLYLKGLRPKGTFEKLSTTGRIIQLASPMGRVLDLVSNFANAGSLGVDRALVGGLDRSLFWKVNRIEGRAAYGLNPLRAARTLNGAMQRWRLHFAEVMGGSESTKFGHSAGKGSVVLRFAGVSDIPAKDYAYTFAVDEMATGKARAELGRAPLDRLKARRDEIIREVAVGKHEEIRLAAEETSLRAVFGQDNALGKGLRGVRSALIGHGNTGDSAAFFLVDHLSRFGPIIANIAGETLDRSPVGIYSSSAKALSRFRNAQLAGRLTVADRRYISSTLAKGIRSAVPLTASATVGDYLYRSGFLRPLGLDPSGNFVEWGTNTWGDFLSSLGPEASAMLYGAEKAYIEENVHDPKQKGRLYWNLNIGLATNQPAYTGIKRLQVAGGAAETLLKYGAQNLVSLTVPGFVRDTARRINTTGEGGLFQPKDREIKTPMDVLNGAIPSRFTLGKYTFGRESLDLKKNTPPVAEVVGKEAAAEMRRLGVALPPLDRANMPEDHVTKRARELIGEDAKKPAQETVERLTARWVEYAGAMEAGLSEFLASDSYKRLPDAQKKGRLKDKVAEIKGRLDRKWADKRLENVEDEAARQRAVSGGPTARGPRAPGVGAPMPVTPVGSGEKVGGIDYQAVTSRR